MPTILISSETTTRYKKFSHDIRSFCSENKVGLAIIQSSNPWIRDYAPVQIANKNYKFNYQPYYHHTPKYREPNPPQTIEFNAHFFEITELNITADGGAILLDDSRKIILLSKTHNSPKFNSYFDELGFSVIHLNPDPKDFTGHLDGIYRIVNRTILYSYSLDSLSDNQWHKDNINLLKAYGYSVSALSDMGGLINWDLYLGIYMNFLVVEKFILIPRAKNAKANRSFHALMEARISIFFKAEFGLETVWINCQETIKDGGAIHCLTSLVD
jgi:agmatine/peptidylarginine deiminase